MVFDSQPGHGNIEGHKADDAMVNFEFNKCVDVSITKEVNCDHLI